MSAAPLGAQAPKPAPAEQAPPEEDDNLKEKAYAFNPLQANKEMATGEFYLHKGKFEAAANRFREAAKWNPTLAEAYLKIGQAEEKNRDRKAAKEAYRHYLEMSPDAKNAREIEHKINRL